MLLTIDAGNTRTKWALFDAAGEIIWQGARLNDELSSAVLLPENLTCSRAVVANVAGEQHAQLLSALLNQYAIQQVDWAKASALACGVINQYEKPESLGIDRWAALVAAWHFEQNTCVVVNAGTAVTIDALGLKARDHVDSAIFMGGIILPGLQLMQQSLGNAAAQLPMLDLQQNIPAQRDIFAKNTADAIHAGALHAVSGAITLMSHNLNAIFKRRPRIILSGGNAHLIKENLIADVTRQALIVDNLVLHGLYLLTNET